MHRIRKTWLLLLPALLLFTFGLAVIKDNIPRTQSKVVDITDKKISSKKDSVFQFGCVTPDVSKKANATIVMLCRNKEIDHVIKSMKSMERRFNQWFNYPWVFLNDEEFSTDFKSKVSQVTNSKVEFGLIPKQDWDFNVDPSELKENLNYQSDRRILYSNLESYHKMCRFYSGKFYKHPLVEKYDWYWRVEPNVEFFCDLTYDPFLEMEKRNKKYGFNIILPELYYTTPGLFRQVMKYIKLKQIKVKDSWKLFTFNSKWTTENYLDLPTKEEILEEIQTQMYIKAYLNQEKKALDNPIADLIISRAKELPRLHEDRMNLQDFNLCHFWSNFEIAKTSLFASQDYQNFYEFLDSSGGFWKERWGDAPIHSLYIGMVLNLSELHYFRDIGYSHDIFMHCPNNSPENQLPYTGQEPLLKADSPKANGVGCRCKCPRNWREPDIEKSKCMEKWLKFTSDKYQDPMVVDVKFWENKLSKMIKKHLRDGGNFGDKLV